MSKGWTQDDSWDSNEISTEAPPPPADGFYMAKIKKAEPRAVGEDQKPGANVQFELTCVLGGKPGEMKRTVYDTFTLTKDAAFKAKQLSIAAGIEMLSGNSFQKVNDWCGELLGQVVCVETKQDTYKGKTNAKPKHYYTEQAGLEAQQAQGAEGSSEGAETPVAAPARRRRS